jgi:TRAP-type C4-dicarboxylate transport system permease small subunit
VSEDGAGEGGGRPPPGPSAIIERGLTALAALALAVLFLAVIGQVALRNLFSVGLSWSDELARFCALALVFLAAPVLALRGSLVAVGLLPESVERRLGRGLPAFSALCTALFGALMVWALWQFLDRAAFFSTPSLGLPNWVFYGPATAGLALVAAAGAVLALRAARGTS